MIEFPNQQQLLFLLGNLQDSTEWGEMKQMCTYFKSIFALFCALLFASSLHATPVTITFDDGENYGFIFSAWVPDYQSGPDAPPVPAPIGALDGGIWTNNDDNAYISVSYIHGAFNALSIDTRSPGSVIPNAYSGLAISLAGFDESGILVACSGAFKEGPASFDWMTINLADDNFSNIFELRIYQGQYLHCNYIDNLVLVPVPQPTAMLLFGTGIAGLAVAGRRKKS